MLSAVVTQLKWINAALSKARRFLLPVPISHRKLEEGDALQTTPFEDTITNGRFEKLDVDKDGILSRQECDVDAIGKLDGWVVNSAGSADADGDETISNEEFYESLLVKLTK